MKMARFTHSASPLVHSRSRRLRFEPLEDRRLLSVGLFEAGQAGEIHGQKWHDINGNGTRDPGDVGLDDWTIELVDPTDGSVVKTTVTTSIDLDEDGIIDPETEAGLYSFTGLAPGNYEVREVASDDWVQTFPLVPTGELSFVETVRDGQDGVDGLDLARSVTVSPDGNYVYAAGSYDDAVAVFSRDGATGELNFVQVLRDGQDGVDGLEGVQSVSISPDGRHVYVASWYDDAVAVFCRDGSSGQLDFVEMLRNGQDGVDGLEGARSVTVSPDGNHVYAVSNANAVAVFRRDGATGQLDFLQVLRNGQDGVQGLYGVSSVTVSANGNHIYVAAGSSQAVAMFSRDGATDRLNFVQFFQNGQGGVEGLDGVQSVSISPDGNHLYAASTYDDAVAVFRRDGTTGQLDFVQVLGDGQDAADGLDCSYVRFVTVSPDGKHVYATSDTHNMLTVFSRDGDTGQLTFLQMLRDSQNSVVDGLDSVSSVTVSPDGKHIYATSFSDDAVAVFRRSFVAEPHQVSLGPDEILTGLDLGSYQMASVSGQKFGDLNGDGVHDIGEPGMNGWTIELVDQTDGLVIATTVTASVDLNEDGTIDAKTEAGWYSFTGLAEGSYEVREVSQPDWIQTFPSMVVAELSPAQVLYDGQDGVDGLAGANSAVVTPDGLHVYVASVTDHAVTAFSRDSDTGRLTFLQVLPVNGLAITADVQVSSDGRHVYVAAYAGSAVMVFARDEITGLLVPVQTITDGQSGVDGLDSVRSLVVTEDGRFVYAAAYGDNALTLFARDAVTGQLTLVETLVDGQDDVDGLSGARSVVLSPNGRHVYVAGHLDSAVAVFLRDEQTGRLTYAQALRNGQDGIQGLRGVYSVTISEDGRNVYACGKSDSAVTVFSRDTNTGQLTFIQVLQYYGDDGLASLIRPRSIMVSPDDTQVYVVADAGYALTVFARDMATGRLDYLYDVQSDVAANFTTNAVASPDGRHVYVASVVGDSVAVFVRDDETWAAPHYVQLALGEHRLGLDFGDYRIPKLVDRHVFYNDSAFDGNQADADAADNGAIATDKAALLPDQTATFANYTTYEKGINGVMVDLRTCTDTDLLDLATDFEFQVGNSPDHDNWLTAPEPIGWSVRKGEGVDGSDRITFVWADRAIEKQWLRVTVKANERTGLVAPDVFYFGNAPGEAGDQEPNTVVNATDEIVARNFQHSAVDPAAIDDPYDYNRDGLVNATDQLIARANQTNPLTMLRLITGQPAAGELLINGGFEMGDFAGWKATSNGLEELTPWTVGPEGGGFFFASEPLQGEYSACNGFDGVAGLSYELYQDVYLPGDAQACTLTTNHRIVYTGGTAEGQDRTLTISVRDTSGNLLESLHETRIVPELLPETDLGWTTLSFDLSAYAGQTVRIHFAEEIPDNYAGPAMVEFDAISLIAEAPDSAKGAEVADLRLSQAAVDWQYELESMQAKNSAGKGRRNVEATVDWLLAAGVE